MLKMFPLILIGCVWFGVGMATGADYFTTLGMVLIGIGVSVEP